MLSSQLNQPLPSFKGEWYPGTTLFIYILSISTSSPIEERESNHMLENEMKETKHKRVSAITSRILTTSFSSCGRRIARAQKLLQHASKYGKRKEETRPRREVVIAHVGRGAIVKCHKSGTQSVKDCHDKAKNGSDEGGVFS